MRGHKVRVTFKSGAQETYRVKNFTVKKSILGGLQEIGWETFEDTGKPLYISIDDIVSVVRL